MLVGSPNRAATLMFAMMLTASCSPEEATDEAAPAPSDVTFRSRGGDVFASQVSVDGTAACGSVVVSVNGTPLPEADVKGSSFTARVPLQPGTNEVSARCVDGGDGATVALEQRLDVRPVARVVPDVVGDKVVLDASRSEGVDATRRLTFEWRVDEEHPADLQLASGGAFRSASGTKLELASPAEDGEYYVALEVNDEEGRSDVGKTYFVVEGGVPRVVDMDREHPSWIDRAVVYAPVPALWGNDWSRSVEKRLPYLKELGVDALWLWPPVTQRTVGQEYAIDDYFQLDSEWGPEEDFRSMVDEAHRLGLKVLADFVPNHLSSESPYFKDTQEHGETSRYWDFFDRDEDGRPTHYFDWEHLPNLNFDNPEVRTMVQQAFTYWVRDMKLDGFRVDVAWGIKKRRPDFWKPWRRELKRVEPDLMLIAEASAVDDYYFSNGFDIGYDWSHDLGQWAWGSIFEFPQEAGALLEGALTDGGRGYSKDAVIQRFINNNDTGVRFVDQHGPEMTRVAATLQFTVPGVPAMFGGDEIGASYEPYSNLTPIPWRDRFNLRDFYKRLIDLKHDLVALAGNQMHILPTGENSSFAFLRPASDPRDSVLVVLNFAGKTKVSLPIDDGSQAFFADNPSLKDHLSGDAVQIESSGKRATIQMDAVSSMVLGGATR